MSLYGVKIIEGEQITPGDIILLMNNKVVWFGKISDMPKQAPYRFDTVHLNPNDVSKLRGNVPRIPSQSGGR